MCIRDRAEVVGTESANAKDKPRTKVFFMENPSLSDKISGFVNLNVRIFVVMKQEAALRYLYMI